MKKLIRYGVIGIGGMGANHANLLLQNKINNACLVSVCDMNKSFANNFADIPFYSNISDFFNKKKNRCCNNSYASSFSCKSRKRSLRKSYQCYY